MALASLGPWIVVLDIGSSSHLGYIIAPGQEANEDNSVICFRAPIKVMVFESTQ